MSDAHEHNNKTSNYKKIKKSSGKITRNKIVAIAQQKIIKSE